ncbi:uncharacterized protein LOC129609538 isoform X2 [Condylostylus longicornis]|nr:uncharacterized protein LOC129609538 isoform X2 [Condylostylus longicornis]
MEYRSFGKTGLKVSKLSIGGGVFGCYGSYDENDAIETIHEALKSGINYIDTAPYYGNRESEKFYGKALKNVPRKAYYIATKVGRYEPDYKKMFDFSAKRTRESVELSLKCLNLDYVDVIQIHDIEFAENLDIILNECLPELEKVVKEGKARFVGVTGYPLKTLKEIILAAPGKFDMVLSYSRYTLFDDSFKEYLQFFIDQKLGIVCASGHGLGLLTNSGPQDWHPASEDIKEKCRKAAGLCKDSNVELGKLAAYYFTNLEGPSTFLSGMQSKELLRMNLKSLKNGLDKKEKEILRQLQETIFTKSVNWEGNEVDRYWNEMKKVKKSN